MKIAFATQDGVHVNEHFRRASQLAVYEISAAGFRLVRVCTFAADRSVKTDQRIQAIADVAIVYGVAYGPSSVLRLARRGLRPATAPAGTPIESVLRGFVEAARDATPAP